jgi:predicted phosphodiesterase
VKRLAIAAGVLILLAVLAGTGSFSSEPVKRAQAPAPKPPAEPGEAVVWAIGDGASGSKAASRLADLAAGENPAFVLYLGDVYESGTAEEFRDNLGTPYAALLERMLPTPGNHDWPNSEEGYAPFWEKVRGEPLPEHYAERAGGWDLLSVNSEGDIEAEAAWLSEQAGNPGTCRLAFWHRARESAGQHGDNEDVEPLWQAVAGRAALVVNGHDHDLQRMDPKDGIVALISGAGGRSFYPVDEDYPGLAWSDEDTYGGLRLTLRQGAATVEFVSAGGKVLDRSTVRCTP